MEIRIVALDDEPPAWRVYLNDFFIVCHSQAEAEETARRARSSVEPLFTPPSNTILATSSEPVEPA